MTIGDIDYEEYYTDDEIGELKLLFRQFDVSGDGAISSSEMMGLFHSVGLALKPYQVDQLIKEFDVDQSGEVEFEEFLVMMVKLMNKRVRADCIDYHQYLTQDKIQHYEAQFLQSDTSGTGNIGRLDLGGMFTRLGVPLNAKQLDSIIAEVDKDGSGSIDFDEFCSMMVKLTGVRKRISMREYVDPEEIVRYRQVFDHYDVSGDGSISVKELDSLLRKMGVVLTKSQVDALLHKYDADGSGEVDFQEFGAIMIDLKKLRRRFKISPATTTAEALRGDGFIPRELLEAGFTCEEMRKGGYTAREMVLGGVRPLDLRQAGYTATQMREAGLGPCALKRVGYSATDLRNAGIASLALHATNHQFKRHDIANYTHSLQATSPQVEEHLTPRVRYFADRRLKRADHRRSAAVFQRLGHDVMKSLAFAPARQSLPALTKTATVSTPWQKALQKRKTVAFAPDEP